MKTLKRWWEQWGEGPGKPQHFFNSLSLVWFVVLFGALSLLHVIIRMRLLLISHKCEMLLSSVPLWVYLDVRAVPSYNQRHTLPSRRCIQLFPACRKHWVRRRGRQRFSVSIPTTPDSPRLRLDPATRPVRSPPTRKALSVGFTALDKDLVCETVANGIKGEAGDKTFCPFSPGLPSSPERPFLPCRNERSPNKSITSGQKWCWSNCIQARREKGQLQLRFCCCAQAYFLRVRVRLGYFQFPSFFSIFIL